MNKHLSITITSILGRPPRSVSVLLQNNMSCFRSEIVPVYSIPDLYLSVSQFFDSFILMANSEVGQVSHDKLYYVNNIHKLLSDSVFRNSHKVNLAVTRKINARRKVHLVFCHSELKYLPLSNSSYSGPV